MLNQVWERIETSREDLLSFTRELINYATPNPPAGNTQALQSFLAGHLEKLGLETIMHDLYPGEPLLVARLKGSEGARCLIFNGHVDVAQVNPDEAWQFDPFEAWWDDRYLYGRGAADMKGGLAAAYWATKAVLESGLRLRQDLLFQSVVGEEAGEGGTKKLLEMGYRGTFAIVPEPTELRVNGQGGVVTMWVTLKSPVTFHDGLRSRLIHAGGGLDGASAIEKMVKVIGTMQELERRWAVLKSYPGLPPGANTINPALIKGGRHPAFIADECSLWYTVHFLPNEKLEDVRSEVMEALRGLSESDPWMRCNPPQVIFGGSSMFRDQGEIFPASTVDPAQPDTACFLETYEKTFSRKAESIVWPCVSDAGWFAEAGIPVVICGPGRLEEAHAVGEKIEIDQLICAAKLYAAFILDYCEVQR